MWNVGPGVVGSMICLFAGGLGMGESDFEALAFRGVGGRVFVVRLLQPEMQLEFHSALLFWLLQVEQALFNRAALKDQS